MKKIFLLLGVLFASVAVNAQLQEPYSFGVDTLTNADTVTYSTSKITGKYDMVFQLKSANVTGTSAGVGRLYKSIDNSFWIATGDTVDISGSGALISVAGTDELYYKLEVISSGTHTTQLTSKYLLKPE